MFPQNNNSHTLVVLKVSGRYVICVQIPCNGLQTEEASLRRLAWGGLLKESSGGLLKEASLRRPPYGGLLKEPSLRKPP